MLVFLSFIICLATAVYVGAPLWRGTAASPRAQRDFSSGGSSSAAVEELQQQRDTLLLALKELEFDRSMSKVEESDYTRLRSELTSEASAVLRRLDELDTMTVAAHGQASHTTTASHTEATIADAALLDADIEAEVLIARARHRLALEKSLQPDN